VNQRGCIFTCNADRELLGGGVFGYADLTRGRRAGHSGGVSCGAAYVR